jgi:hypothetical protein
MRISAAGCCALLVACVPHGVLRGSAFAFLTPKGGTLSVEAKPEVVEAAVELLLAQRGAAQVDREVVPSGAVVLSFKGPRGESVQGLALGSFYAVRVATAPPGTEVAVLGKPTVGGQELCSPEDVMVEEARHGCQDVVVPQNWEGRAQVTGREEALVVAWLLAALAQTFTRLEPLAAPSL